MVCSVLLSTTSFSFSSRPIPASRYYLSPTSKLLPPLPFPPLPSRTPFGRRIRDSSRGTYPLFPWDPDGSWNYKALTKPMSKKAIVNSENQSLQVLQWQGRRRDQRRVVTPQGRPTWVQVTSVVESRRRTDTVIRVGRVDTTPSMTTPGTTPETLAAPPHSRRVGVTLSIISLKRHYSDTLLRFGVTERCCMQEWVSRHQQTPSRRRTDPSRPQDPTTLEQKTMTSPSPTFLQTFFPQTRCPKSPSFDLTRRNSVTEEKYKFGWTNTSIMKKWSPRDPRDMSFPNSHC